VLVKTQAETMLESKNEKNHKRGKKESTKGVVKTLPHIRKS